MSRKLFSDPISIFLIVAVILVVPFWLILDLSEPQPEGFTEVSLPGGHPRGFQWNLDYQVRILVKNFERQVEYYQVSFQFQFEDGQTLGFTPDIFYADGTQTGRFIEKMGSWETIVTISNSSQVLNRQDQVEKQPLKVEIILLIDRDGVFQSVGSVSLWAYYPT